VLHDGLEMTAEAPHALPSEGADFDPLAVRIFVEPVPDEAFFVQTFHGFTERSEADGEDR